MSIPQTQTRVVFKQYASTADALNLDTSGPVPTFGDSDVLVKVVAAGLNHGDYKVLSGGAKIAIKLTFPAVPGLDFSGVVAAIGSAVSHFEVGDEVYGSVVPGPTGSCQEYMTVSTTRDGILKKPSNISHVQAATVGSAGETAAVMVVDLAKLNEPEPGVKVLVVGASGGVGTWCVLLAKAYGAEVTGVCSTTSLEYVKTKLNADRVIDYKAAPLSEQLTTANEFDIVFDCVGGTEYWQLAHKILKRSGSFISTSGPHYFGGESSVVSIAQMLSSVVYRKTVSPFNYYLPIAMGKTHFPLLDELVSSKKVVPIANNVFPLGQYRQAMELLIGKHACGKIVLEVGRM